MVTNELPFLGGYLLIASTALALAQGQLDSVGGVIVGVAALVVLLGLLVIVRRALRADAALHNPTPARRPWGLPERPQPPILVIHGKNDLLVSPLHAR